MLVLAALCLKHEGFTGLRRGDAVRFGRQHVRDGVGTIKIEKSGFTLAVTLPILPVLARTLKAGPCGDLTLLANGANRSPRNPSATYSRPPVALLACQA